jgi:hypothetical protein
VFRELLKRLGAQQQLTTTYHPQTDGLVERLNQTLKNIIKRFCNTRATDWDQFLRGAVFAYNTSVQESTGESPFFLLYGRDARLPADWYARRSQDDLTKETGEYRSRLLTSLAEARAIANANLRGAQEKQKRLYDRRTKEYEFRVGDLVALSPPPGAIDSGPKMARRKRASYRITEQRGPTTFVIDPCPGSVAEGHQSEVVHANRLTPLLQRSPL